MAADRSIKTNHGNTCVRRSVQVPINSGIALSYGVRDSQAGKNISSVFGLRWVILGIGAVIGVGRIETVRRQ
jgi:hypothetical protein